MARASSSVCVYVMIGNRSKRGVQTLLFLYPPDLMSRASYHQPTQLSSAWHWAAMFPVDHQIAQRRIQWPSWKPPTRPMGWDGMGWDDWPSGLFRTHRLTDRSLAVDTTATRAPRRESIHPEETRTWTCIWTWPWPGVEPCLGDPPPPLLLLRLDPHLATCLRSFS